MSGSGKQCALILLFAIVLAVLQTAYGTPVNNANLGGSKGEQIIYRRWVRRRPSSYPTDLYVDEVMEEFHVPRLPPAHHLTDEDVDRIIRCDFEPNLKECEELSKPQVPVNSPSPTIAPQDPVRPTHMPTRPWTPTPAVSTRATSATTIAPEMVYTTRSTTTSSTSTTTTAPTTSSEDLPFLPDIPMSQEDITKEPDYYAELEDNNVNNVNEEEMENAISKENTDDFEEVEEEEEEAEEEVEEQVEEQVEEVDNDFDNNL